MSEIMPGRQGGSLIEAIMRSGRPFVPRRFRRGGDALTSPPNAA